MRIFLVRHGQSEANADKSLHVRMADHAIGLSELGMEQARKTGTFLAQKINNIGMLDYGEFYPPKVRIWVSPYERARQTANLIYARMNEFSGHYRLDRKEHLLLCEQQFGLFDGISHEGTKSEIERLFPAEYAHYKKCEAFEGGFWARMPLGESKFDLSVRVHQAFGTFHRDKKKHKIENLIIVAHGSTNRAFVMMWQHLGFEWFEKEPNPRNGSVRLLEDGEDKGYIFSPE